MFSQDRSPVATSVNSPRILRFGVFEADLLSGELRKSGVRIKLQDRPFQILAILLAQPGAVVTREELQKRLWPADTFVDFEHGLNTAITKLRQALADDADNPRFIETLPRRGYRFVAPVSSDGNGHAHSPDTLAPNTEAVPTAPIPSAAPGVSTATHVRRSTLYWTVGIVFLLGLGIASWFFLSRSTARPNFSAVRIAPLNGLPRESDAAFSPDGSQVAFVWSGRPLPSGEDQRVHIYVSQLGAEAPRRLTNSEGWEIAPVWSPDGKYIAFIRITQDHQNDGMYIASAQGGSERRVYPLDLRNSTKELDWSPDGKYLAFAERNSPDEPAAVYLLSLDTLQRHPLTAPPRGVLGDSSPAFSPDGRSLAFLRDRLDTQEIFVVPSQGGEPRQVTFDNRIIQGVSWSADGRDFIFSSNRAGASSLWRVPVSGGTPERLPIIGGMVVRPTVARQGNRMAYTSVNYTSDIWRAELPAAGKQLAPPAKFITSTALEEGPQYSPDGQRIAFQSTRTGDYEIWRCDADGTNLVQLTHFGGPLTGTPHWSPDGREIVFDSRPAGHSQVFVINAEGGQPRQVTIGDAESGVADWSADGKWVYFGSSRTGSWEIWKIPSRGGAAIQVTRHGGFAPEASRDGKYIYYARGRDLPGLWRVPVDGGEEVKILDAPPPTAWAYFVVVDKGIYFADAPDHKTPGIYFYDFATRKSSPVRLLDRFGSQGAPGLSISPDGRYAIYTALAPPSVNIMLVENFRP
jgi:Tol biopolymer transport system component/DNA-binding winged helix-turn-helix (wHTH) protein